MRKIITIIILSCFACVAKAENDFYTEFKQQATEALKYVNKRIFTTGLLSDYGFSWVDYGEFNGHLNDSVCLNYDCWKAIYGGLYDSQINNNISMPELEAVTENLEKTGAVGIIYYEYDRFREDALEEGLITNSDGYVRLVSGKPSPFERKECFAVSFPMNQKEGQIMIMLLKKDAYYSNTGASITKMEVDFDGSGYKTVAWNTPIRWVYSSTGVKEIKFRASFSNGKCLECRNIVNVTKSKGSDPSKVEGPQLAIEKFADVEADGNHDGGSIDVAYISSIGSSTGKKFVRPLIIVGDMDLSALSEDLKMDLSILAQKSGTSLAELNRIFDIAYINYNDGLGDLTRNGEMVRQAIKKINANKSQYGCDKSYVIGLGMGGVVARIALNKMEIAGENHNVKKFIAINSPFQGINIPIGLQFSILQIDKFINRIESKVSQSINEFANIRAVADLFDKPAIKQLLIHRINPNLEYDNSFHDALLSFKGWMINPKNCESIAITAGYYHDNYIDRLFQPHSDLLIIENFKQHYKDPEHPNRGYWLGRGTVTIDINAKSLPENKIESIYSGELTYKEKVVIFHVRNSVTERASFNSTIDMFPIDGTNGCYIPIDLIVGKDELINSMLKIDKFCFLPTYSALDVSDISKYFGLSNIETPFDKYFVTEKSQSYGDFSGVVDILMREVAPVITGDTRDVLGDVVLKADNFIDLPLVKYEWKFRNGKFKVVSQSGAEAVVRPLDYSGATDYVTVTATPLLDIPELSGLKVTFPEREITSEEIEIEGLESISRDDNYYSLTYLPNDDCTVDWSCSDGLVVEKTIGEAALAHVKEFSKDSWIEATLRHGDTSYKFHKDLICARIDSIRFSVVHKKWNKASQAYKYGYM